MLFNYEGRVFNPLLHGFVTYKLQARDDEDARHVLSQMVRTDFEGRVFVTRDRSVPWELKKISGNDFPEYVI